MLKKNVNELNSSVFEAYATCPILIAGDKTTGYNGMTVSWGGLGTLWGRNVAFVFVRHSRHTYNFIEQSDSVTLSFLSDTYKNEKAYFGSKSGADTNKFLDTNLHPTFEPDFDGYYIAEAAYVLKMKKLYSLDLPYEKLSEELQKQYYPNGDMHRLYVCEIKQYLVNEE